MTARQLQNYLLWWLEQQHLHQSPRQLQAAADLFIADLPDEPWMVDGSCIESINPEAWFPGKGQNTRYGDTALAVKVCRTICPVQRQCLEYALSHDVDGIWGGTTAHQRRRLTRNKQPRGASA